MGKRCTWSTSSHSLLIKTTTGFDNTNPKDWLTQIDGDVHLWRSQSGVKLVNFWRWKSLGSEIVWWSLNRKATKAVITQWCGWNHITFTHWIYWKGKSPLFGGSWIHELHQMSVTILSWTPGVVPTDNISCLWNQRFVKSFVNFADTLWLSRWFYSTTGLEFAANLLNTSRITWIA